MGKLQTERREQECEVFRTYHINHAALSAFEMHNCAMLVWRFKGVFIARKEVRVVDFQDIVVPRNILTNYNFAAPVMLLVG